MSCLFDPISMGPLNLKNRLVMTAMSTRFAGTQGEVTDRLTEYYATRAAGGTALITVEEAYIHPQLPHIKNALGIYADRLLPGLKKLTDRIHEEGGLASIQIGLYFRQQVNGFPRYAVSAEAPDCGSGCIELTGTEIRYLTGCFADAAERAKRAGFDAVEIHACHGCLLAEFLSPFWNHRTDAYGGSRKGRFRFPLEVLGGIRKRLGKDYPVLFRISGSEFTPEGFSPEDAVVFSQALEENDATAVSISGGLGHVNHIAIPPGDVPRGLLLPIGESIKSKVNIPVIVANSMTPRLAVDAIERKMADLIGLGRPLIADPEWPRKVREGREEEIRQCLRCNQGCFGGLRDPARPWISCLYNKVAGREFEGCIREADTRQRIVVIGGGPTGCEAARVLRLRGHEVVLLEKSDRLGGQINTASIPPKKGDFRRMIDFYEVELKRLGTDVRLETTATPTLIDDLNPDAVVAATGAVPIKPPIAGGDKQHVVTAQEILSGKVVIDQGPVVVIGGGATGLDVADFISGNDMAVTVVEMLDAPGRDIYQGIGVREGLLTRLSEKNAAILTGRRVMEILDDSVRISDRPLMGGGKEVNLPAQVVVLAVGMKPADAFLPPENQRSIPWYRIGDCLVPGNAFRAIEQAFELALRI